MAPTLRPTRPSKIALVDINLPRTSARLKAKEESAKLAAGIFSASPQKPLKRSASTQRSLVKISTNKAAALARQANPFGALLARSNSTTKPRPAAVAAVQAPGGAAQRRLIREHIRVPPPSGQATNQSRLAAVPRQPAPASTSLYPQTLAAPPLAPGQAASHWTATNDQHQLARSESVLDGEHVKHALPVYVTDAEKKQRVALVGRCRGHIKDIIKLAEKFNGSLQDVDAFDAAIQRRRDDVETTKASDKMLVDCAEDALELYDAKVAVAKQQFHEEAGEDKAETFTNGFEARNKNGPWDEGLFGWNLEAVNA